MPPRHFYGGASNVGCQSPLTISPDTNHMYGVEIPTKRRSIIVQQAQINEVQVILLNKEGNPFDLSFCSGGSILAKIREVISTCADDIVTVTGTIVVEEEGIVSFSIPTTITKNPGVYLMEVGVLNADDELILSNQFYIWVNRGLFGTPDYPHAGPPALDEVRLYLRDNGPEENLLIDNFDFDLSDICIGVENSVRYWNESQPPICKRFTTITYPLRERWLLAVSGCVFISTANRFLRNTLPYSAGGISVDDLNKWQPYLTLGQQRWQEYKEYVKTKKVQLNAGAMITSTGSPYDWASLFAY